jgi:hypothetical protein
VSDLLRTYVALGLDKKDVSFEVDAKVVPQKVGA